MPPVYTPPITFVKCFFTVSCWKLSETLWATIAGRVSP